MVPVEGGQGRGGECVSDSGISLEVVEMAANDPLDVDAGGMVGKDKGNPISVAGGKREGEGQSARDVSDRVGGPVNNAVGEFSDEVEGGHFRGCLVKIGLIICGTYVVETEELGEWNRLFTGGRVQGCIVQ
eukprot:g34839.t1